MISKQNLLFKICGYLSLLYTIGKNADSPEFLSQKWPLPKLRNI